MGFPAFDAQRLRECHDRLRSNIGSGIEPFEIVAKVEQFRWYWRPERVRIVLLAESHVHTSADDFSRRMNLEGLPLSGYPPEFVRFVYCLGYGENGMLDRRLPKNTGTPQFWKLFHGCVNRVSGNADFCPILKGGEPDLRKRILNKIELLERLRAMGVWLVDAGICGLYLPGRPKPPQPIIEGALRVSWDGYVRKLLNGAAPRHVICIGKGVNRMAVDGLRLMMGEELTVVPQPQARISSEGMLRVYRILYESCRKHCGRP